jgi:hypothetical protein
MRRNKENSEKKQKGKGITGIKKGERFTNHGVIDSGK